MTMLCVSEVFFCPALMAMGAVETSRHSGILGETARYSVGGWLNENADREGRSVSRRSLQEARTPHRLVQLARLCLGKMF